MKKLFQIECTIEKSEGDILSDSLFDAGAMSVSTSDIDGSTIRVTAIFDEIEHIIDSIKTAYTMHELADDDWKYKWLDDFTGFAINDDIYITPPGVIDESVKAYPYIIYLDPRDAFGDGRHPTTEMCLKLIHEIISSIDADKRNAISFLDVGTGTGILSILAGLMGVIDIHAMDISTDSVGMFKRNMSLNNTIYSSARCADISQYRPGKKFDVIAANILTAAIVPNLPALRGLLSENGRMILSGIGSLWRDEIIQALGDNGLEILQEKSRDNWLAFTVGNKDR